MLRFKHFVKVYHEALQEKLHKVSIITWDCVNVELEHGSKAGEWNLTNNDAVATAKIALAHLDEIPDYYTRLKRMEESAK